MPRAAREVWASSGMRIPIADRPDRRWSGKGVDISLNHELALRRPLATTEH